jgi:hypothetical protein
VAAPFSLGRPRPVFAILAMRLRRERDAPQEREAPQERRSPLDNPLPLLVLVLLVLVSVRALPVSTSQGERRVKTVRREQLGSV